MLRQCRPLHCGDTPKSWRRRQLLRLLCLMTAGTTWWLLFHSKGTLKLGPSVSIYRLLERGSAITTDSKQDGNDEKDTNDSDSNDNKDNSGDVANPWMRQPGPEPEDGWAPSNFTVVTAMFDIGRKDWPGFRRNYSKYLSHMTHVMQLRTNIIAFVDSKAAEAARRMRSHFGADKTEVVEMRLQDLPYFRHRERMQEIMDSEEFRRDNPLAAGKHPEATYVEYDIVTLSKPFFLDRATRLDPFNSSYFVWLDGGYAHSDNVFPDDGVWRPKDLFEHSDKVTMIERKRGVDFYRNHKDHLHKMEVAVLNGGFIGGGKAVLQRLYAMSEEVVADWLVRGVVDDDQSLIMAVYYKDPSMFRLVRGDWHDAFRLFHRPK